MYHIRIVLRTASPPNQSGSENKMANKTRNRRIQKPRKGFPLGCRLTEKTLAALLFYPTPEKETEALQTCHAKWIEPQKPPAVSNTTQA